jgi:hypothetical protein
MPDPMKLFFALALLSGLYATTLRAEPIKNPHQKADLDVSGE